MPTPTAMPSSGPGIWCRRRILIWGTVACVTAFALRIVSVVRPMLIMDDFQILAQSWTWQDAHANLWVPANEHSMPLGRLTTWVLVQLAVRPSNVPFAFALQGPLALLAGMLLVYLLVRREMNHPFPALLAMTLFGVTTHYQQVVYWFAAGFALLAFDTLLLGLLAAQRWRQTGRYRHLVLSSVWAALAPGWFGSGVLAGPLCALYLIGPDPRMSCPQGSAPHAGWQRWLAGLAPLLGTAVSLAVTMPRNAERILNLPRVELVATAWQTFDPLVGLGYTARALVDDVIPGALGVAELTCPVGVVVAGLVLLAAGGVWWWRRAPHRRLLLLGLGMVFSSYLLIFSVRSYFDYRGMHHWSRYHLFAQLGLVLFVCGGWPLRRFVEGSSEAALSPWKVDLLAACFLGLLLTTQLPRAEALACDPQQAADFRRIEEVDARCRSYHIDAATARQALPRLEIAGCLESKVNERILNGWDFLRGSDDPRPVTIDEARRLLDPEAAP